MKTIRCVIADDEPLARKLLRSMLDEQSDIEVVDECANGDQVLKAIEEHDPDLLFLDVQMPKRTGIEALESLGRARSTEVIFVTAYDQFALRAFDENAVDYLLKPFDDQRLEEALDRARRRLSAGKKSGDTDRLVKLIEDLGGRVSYQKRIAVKDGERIVLLHTRDIERLEADGKYIQIHNASGEEFSIRERLSRMDDLLDPADFLRISRSAIVNIAYIDEIQQWFRGEFIVLLRSGRKIATTRTYRDGLKELIDRG